MEVADSADNPQPSPIDYANDQSDGHAANTAS